MDPSVAIAVASGVSAGSGAIPLVDLLGIEATDRTVTIAGAVTIAILIGFSGFYSSSEIAMFSLPNHRLDALVAEGRPNAATVKALKDDPHRLLVTILVGNNIVNIAMSSISTALLGLYFSGLQAVLIATFGITSLVLLFGESAPKSYAVENTESWALRIARPLKYSEYALYPLVVTFDALTRIVNRVMGSTGAIEAPYVTRTEIQQIIESGRRAGVIEEDEQQMLQHIFRFRNRIAKEVMTPRLDIVAVPAEASLEEAIETCVENGRHRLPVFEETLDDVVGIVELGDLVGAHRGGEAVGPADLAEEPTFVPESKDVDELLQEMRRERREMVIVVDEFGTTAGLITIQDITEEIVGEILEGGEEQPIVVIDDDTVVVQGEINVHEVNEILDVELPEGEEFETIAGFVFNRLGRLADPGDTIHHGGVRIDVERVENTRIRRARITRVEREPMESETDSGSDER